MTARVIGLGGRLRSGKDEVADYLVREHGFVKIGMSDALHEAMLALNPLVPINAAASFTGGVYGEFVRYSQLVGQIGYVEAKKNPEVRSLLQRLGTEVGRNMVGENTWVNISARKIDDYLRADQPVVLTGLRFPNELTMIRQFAGRAVWINRPGVEASASAASHASENGVSPNLFDSVIENDGTLEDLYVKASHLL